jgi:WD40 repeat protein
MLEDGVELLLVGHDDVVNKLVWSSDGTRIASASDDGSVRIWDAETGGLLEILTYNGPIYAMDWSPDGTKIAYGGANLSGGVPEVKIVDVSDIGLMPEATQDAVPTP